MGRESRSRFRSAIASLLERSERAGWGEYPSVEDSPPPDRLAPVDLPTRGRYEDHLARELAPRSNRARLFIPPLDGEGVALEERGGWGEYPSVEDSPPPGALSHYATASLLERSCAPTSPQGGGMRSSRREALSHKGRGET
jgi:hypothetical protein